MENVKAKKQEIKKEKSGGILNFPSKLNNITIILITVVYAFIAFWALFSFFPEYNYVVVPEYEHVNYNYEIDPYIKSTNAITKSATGTVAIKHSYTAYLYNNYATALNNVRFQFSGLTNMGTMDYISGVDYWSSTSAPTIHTMMSNQTISGDGYQKLFGKIQYNYKRSEEETLKRTLIFAEEIIKLKKSELNSAKFSDKATVLGKLNFSVKANEPVSDSTNYTITNTINLINSSEKFHLDYQAFIVTSDKEIYPIGGLYNYYYFSTVETSVAMTSKVNKTIDIEYIYVKGIYTDKDNITTEILYKVDFKSLLG
ncbi:MAG: hypothetical protein WC929_04045 [Bacilli bacterium]|jgi:hypothetical protein